MNEYLLIFRKALGEGNEKPSADAEGAFPIPLYFEISFLKTEINTQFE